MFRTLKPPVRLSAIWVNDARILPGTSYWPIVLGVGPLGGEQAGEADQQQHHAAPDGQLGRHRPARRLTPLADRLEQRGKPEPADDRADRQRQRHPRVTAEGQQAVGVEREATVVERLHGVEDARPEGPPERVVVGQPEPTGDQHGHHRLAGEDGQRDPAEQPAHVTDAELRRLGLHQQPVAQPELTGDHQDDQRRDGEDAEAAELGEQGDHQQSPAGPVVRRVGDRHAGDRHGRGGGEERGDHGWALRARRSPSAP